MGGRERKLPREHERAEAKGGALPRSGLEQLLVGCDDDPAASGVAWFEPRRLPPRVVEGEEEAAGRKPGVRNALSDGGEIELPEEGKLPAAPARPLESRRQIRRAAEPGSARAGRARPASRKAHARPDQFLCRCRSIRRQADALAESEKLLDGDLMPYRLGSSQAAEPEVRIAGLAELFPRPQCGARLARDLRARAKELREEPTAVTRLRHVTTLAGRRKA